MSFLAPIDHQVAYHNAMAQHLSEQSGVASGAMIPNSTQENSIADMPKPIRMKVQPHIMRSKVQNSLSAPNPGASLAKSIIK